MLVSDWLLNLVPITVNLVAELGADVSNGGTGTIENVQYYICMNLTESSIFLPNDSE